MCLISPNALEFAKNSEMHSYIEIHSLLCREERVEMLLLQYVLSFTMVAIILTRIFLKTALLVNKGL